MDTILSIKVPALLGIIATHSLDTEVKGLRDIVAENEQRIRSGLIANQLLTTMRNEGASKELLAAFKEHQADLGYGLLLFEHAQDPLNPTEDEIKVAARASVPPVWITYYAFRAMLGLAGLVGLAFLGAAFFLWYKRDLHVRTKLLKFLVYAIPLPFICCEMGWILAEIGRQPWAIQDVLPTFLATSTLSPWDVGLSLLCFIGIYTLLLAIEMKLMVNAIKLGPTLTNPEPDGKGYPPLPPTPPTPPAAPKSEDTAESLAEVKSVEADAKKEETKVEEAKAEETKAATAESETKAEEAKVEETKAATAEVEIKPEEAKVEDTKEEEAKAQKVQAESKPKTKTRSKAKAKAEAQKDGGVLNAV